jgi:hypothetical protein
VTRFVSEALAKHERCGVRAYAIFADAVKEDATAFYTKHQFQPLVSRPQTLFLPMKTAQDLVSTLGRRPRRSQSISGFASMGK